MARRRRAESSRPERPVRARPERRARPAGGPAAGGRGRPANGRHAAVPLGALPGAADTAPAGPPLRPTSRPGADPGAARAGPGAASVPPGPRPRLVVDLLEASAPAPRWRRARPTGRPVPPLVRAGGGMAGPITTWMVRGLGRALPLGMARSEPPMPIGTMGAPVRADRKAAPSMRSSITGPSRRVPSGKSTSTCPWRSTSSARWSASRSADSRCTGKAPTLRRSLPNHLFFHISSFVMKKSLRSVQKAEKAKSAKERCTGARMTGPVAGTCSLPVTLGRNSVHRAVTKMARSDR